MFRRNSGFKPTMSNSVDAPTPNPRGFTFSEWFVSNPELFDGDKKMSAEEKKLYALMSKLCSWFCINVVFFFVTAVSGSLWLNSSRTVIISTWVAQTRRFSICGTYLIHPCPITTTATVRRMLVKLHTSSQWSTLLKRRTSLLVTWTLQPFVNRNGLPVSSWSTITNDFIWLQSRFLVVKICMRTCETIVSTSQQNSWWIVCTKLSFFFHVLTLLFRIKWTSFVA